MSVVSDLHFSKFLKFLKCFFKSVACIVVLTRCIVIGIAMN